MEYELNPYNALLLKKILILFRHISADLQIIASENGLNLYALNPSNSVWLHIQLGKGFFERIQFKSTSSQSVEPPSNVKHWYVSTKQLCQSLTILVPPSQKSCQFGAVLTKDLNSYESLKSSFGLEKLIIKEYQDSVDFLSLIFICSNKNIVRSTTIGFQEYKLSIPEDLGWSNWHYLRISPGVIYKSICPFSSQYNDLSITYKDAKEDLLLNVINNTSALTSSKNKKKAISGKVLINSRHFHKLDLDDDLIYPADITIGIKEFLSLVSFCESIRCPLSLILRKPGDPVIALFGGSVEACESITSNLNIHNIVYTGCKETTTEQQEEEYTIENAAISGSLWISSFKGKGRTEDPDDDEFEERPVEQMNIIEKTSVQPQQVHEHHSRYSEKQLDSIYKVLLKDFETIAKIYIYYYFIAICLAVQSFKLSSNGFNSYMMKDSFNKLRSYRHINRFNDTVLNSVVDDKRPYGLIIDSQVPLRVINKMNNQEEISIDQPKNEKEIILNDKEIYNEIDIKNINNMVDINDVDGVCNINNLSESNKSNQVNKRNQLDEVIQLDENKTSINDNYIPLEIANRDMLTCDDGLLTHNNDEHVSTKKERKLRIDKSVIYTIPHDDYIVVGVVLTTYGLRGHVKVKSYTSQPEIRLCEPGYRYLKIPFNNEKVIPIKLERGKCSGNKDIYIVKFEGFDDVAQAQRLSKAQITIPLVEAPPLEEDTYYSRDILGLNMYLYNDVSKTKLGNVVGFVHRSDLASRKKYEDICEDLIEVQMDMNISLKTLIDVANASKMKIENKDKDNNNKIEGKYKNNKIKETKNKGPTIVTERELDEADDLVDMYEEFDRPNFKSLLYLKCYECSICGKEFSNHTIALNHEMMHEEMGDNNKENEGLFSRWEERDKEYDNIEYENDGEEEEDYLENKEMAEKDNKRRYIKNKENKEDKPRVISIEDILNTETAKPIRRFYVPLVRNETVKYIDVENKSIYVDPYTIFIGEDPKRQ